MAGPIMIEAAAGMDDAAANAIIDQDTEDLGDDKGEQHGA
jgi:hypothetical protein